ncbi:15215_t:CDS:2, partial [Acaulospora morrowiae]
MFFEDMLTDEQREIVRTLNTWAQQMVTLVEKNSMVCYEFTLKNLFIGYDPEETIQSLVISITHQHKEETNKNILSLCKESLIAIASADGIIRATKSAINKKESLRWKEVYFSSAISNNQHHENLADYFMELFYSVGIINPVPLLVIVNTFSNIDTDVKKCLMMILRVHVERLSNFRTKAQLQNRVKNFWLESDDQILVIQCDMTTANSRYIKLIKFIIEQYRNEFLRTRKEDVPAKHACIILHINREQETNFSSFNFMCGWRIVTLNSLVPQEKNLISLLDRSLKYILNITYTFEEILKQELQWCLQCMKYPSTENSNNHLRVLDSEILKHPKFIDCLKEKVLIWLEKKSTVDWQYEVASNKRLLYPYSSFSAALQARIRTMVRDPIARTLFALEKLFAIKTFFDIDQPGNEESPLILLWENLVKDPKVIEIDKLPEPTPNQYVLPNKLYDLQFPFSYYFLRKIDDFKDIFLAELDKLKQDNENCDGSGDLFFHVEVMAHEALKSNVYSLLSYLRGQIIEPHLEKYFNDFVTIVSAIDGENNRELLSSLLRQLLGEEKMYDPVLLHAYWWINSSTILTDMQLAQMCPSIVKDFTSRGSRFSFEEFLVHEITTMMLNKICGKDVDGINSHQIDMWLREVNKVLTYSGKLQKTRKLPSFQLLRICNELVASKSIP